MEETQWCSWKVVAIRHQYAWVRKRMWNLHVDFFSRMQEVQTETEKLISGALLK